jgi:hypothetical protein
MSDPANEKETSQEIAPTTAIPVKSVFFQALGLPIHHAAVIGRYALLLLAVQLPLVMWPAYLLENPEYGAYVGLLPLLILFAIAATIVWTIACHRVFIRGPESMAGHGLIWWSSREWRFIEWMLVILLRALPILIVMLLVYVPILFLVTDGLEKPTPVGFDALGFLLFLPVFYVIGRSSILLPATAIDERPSMKWAWSVTKGNGLRLMVLVGLFPLLTETILELVPAQDSLVYSVIVFAIHLYVAAVEIAILSLSYRELVRSQPAECAAQ